jgi:hypothetical protein
VIDRFYYDDSNRSLGQPNPSQAVRHDVVVLMSLPESEVRFALEGHTDYAEGLMDGSLAVFFGGSRRVTLEYTITYHSDASNMGELAAKAPDSVHGDEELHITLAFGGRLWSMPVDTWRHRELIPEDDDALTTALDDGLREALQVVDSGSRLVLSARQACSVLTAPLLSRTEPDACSPFPFAWDVERVLLRTRAIDCDFDAGFGYPCSMNQKLSEGGQALVPE